MTAEVVTATERLDGRFAVVFVRSDGSFPTIVLDRSDVERLASDPLAAAELLRKVSR